jgi:hypothetical protein
MINLYDGNNVCLRAALSFDPFNRTAMDLRLRYGQTTASDIWVFDGANHNERRRSAYPGYKAQREPLGQDIYAQVRLWRELLKLSPAAQIEVPEWEADDVIATVARQLARKGVAVVIHSNDLDYAQLTNTPLIAVNGIKKMPTTARFIPLYKACVGDASDNIKGIPGFGKGTWEAVSSHYRELEAAIVAGDPSAFEGLPLPKRVKTWLTDPSNVELVQTMLLITHFYEVPEKELNAGVIPGKPNAQAVDELLRKYFL